MNKAKLAYNAYVSQKEPISLVHFVTNRCNARCKHCFIDFDDPETFKGDLSLEEIDKMTKTMGKSLLNVNLTGGEPLLHPQFYEVVQLYFKNTTVESVYVNTNGNYTDMTKKLIERFIESGVKGKLFFSISLDNFKEDHDKNRRLEGLYENAMKTYHMIHAFKNPNITCNIGITVTGHNYANVVPLYHHLRKESVTSMSAIIMREEGIIKKIPDQVKKNILDAYVELTDQIKKDHLKGDIHGYGDHLQGTLMNAKNFLVYDKIKESYLDPHFISHCPAGALFGVIYNNGDVYPCEILYENKLGSLREYDMNFMKLWGNAETKKCKKFIKDTDCNCTYECAWSINTISNAKHVPKLFGNSVQLWKNGAK